MAKVRDRTAAATELGRGMMADAHDSGFEMEAHRGTYSGFTNLMFWGTIVSFAVGAAVVLLIAS